MESYRRYNGGGEAQNGAVEGLLTSGRRSHHFDEEQDQDLHQSEKSDPGPH